MPRPVLCLLELLGAGTAATRRAALARASEPVFLLLQSKAVDVNAADAYGHTPLMLASLRGHMEVMRLLFEAGAQEEPSEPSAEYGQVARELSFAPPEATATRHG